MEVAVLGSPSLISPMVSVDVNKLNERMMNNRSVRGQELCESGGGLPGLQSLINLRFLWT